MFSIGELSKRTGVKVPTIRFYEQAGLLPEPPRTQAGRRLYGTDDERRLAFIRHTRDLGFEMDALRALLELSDQPDRPCGEVDAIARAHLAAVEAKISQLTALKDELARMVKSCSHGQVSHCRVIEALADHRRCDSINH
ncbi:MAG: helix-turn-helix domain-containing protein [Rhizorhabdus sp.]|uniref:MerR family transcriptional regulator n=1 Tax=Rhizorhabdus sp. TaxID=1968843 RepID=UPI001B52B90C|nr:helix-turn-helix domain-containing protein [Rhizorhabdus sp.]MBP8231227.1 helix-turn-helix domain-containing protein [Rhizorhabdus sp.]